MLTTYVSSKDNAKSNYCDIFVIRENTHLKHRCPFMLVISYPKFPQFLLYFRCKLGVTFAQRYFHDECQICNQGVASLNPSLSTTFKEIGHEMSHLMRLWHFSSSVN